jgi:serine/threonine protein kinase
VKVVGVPNHSFGAVEPVTGDRYRVGHRVQTRESGELVAARDLDLGRDVVIKRLRSASSPRAVARFLREARIQGRLEHPAIPQVHEIGYDDVGRPYYATQKLTGTALDLVLADPETPHSRRSLLHAFVDVCFAIETAHAQGVIHRNLEPGKILLGELGQVYVLDWGLARVATDRDDLDVVPVDACGEIDVEDLEPPVVVEGPRERKTIGMFAVGNLGGPADTEREPVPVPHHRAALAFGSPWAPLPKVARLGSEPPAVRTFAHTVSRDSLKSITPPDPPERCARGSIPPPGLTVELIVRNIASDYIAPEQARGERCLDGRADVYSLGCILRQILGTRDVPPELVEVERRATRADRDTRLESARELGEAVQRYLDGDRDHEQRATAARAHLAKAHASALSNDARAAIREAGRALAIDPSLTAAADLIGRLVVAPPKDVPA